MDHVAILKKSKIKSGDNLLGDILSGAKTIESRWYVNKVAPWDKVKGGDTVYFKESGYSVSARAQVAKVIQYENLDLQTMDGIIKNYARQISPHTDETEFRNWLLNEKKKRFCILIFLASAKKVEPFNINKKGFGSSSAWLCVGDIKKVRL